MQEAAYETLLRQRRQNFHERIAQVIEASFPEAVAAQPELLAHHYGAAGRNRSAIQYWLQAGARARKRSAEIEAIEHFTTALELLDKAPESAERTAQELACWTALGQAYLITQGYAAEATHDAFEKAFELSGHVNDPEQQFLSAWGILAYHFIRGDMARALELSDESIKRAEASGNQSFRAVALGSRGIILYSLGDFERSADQVKRGLALYGPEAQEEMAATIRPRCRRVEHRLWLAQPVDPGLSRPGPGDGGAFGHAGARARPAVQSGRPRSRPAPATRACCAARSAKPANAPWKPSKSPKRIIFLISMHAA